MRIENYVKGLIKQREDQRELEEKKLIKQLIREEELSFYETLTTIGLLALELTPPGQLAYEIILMRRLLQISEAALKVAQYANNPNTANFILELLGEKILEKLLGMGFEKFEIQLPRTPRYTESKIILDQKYVRSSIDKIKNKLGEKIGEATGKEVAQFVIKRLDGCDALDDISYKLLQAHFFQYGFSSKYRHSIDEYYKMFDKELINKSLNEYGKIMKQHDKVVNKDKIEIEAINKLYLKERKINFGFSR